MYDESFQPRNRRPPFNSAYPNETRFVEDISRMGVNETLPSRVTGEVELIARSSYRLGHAENTASVEAYRADKLERELRDTQKLLEEARGQVSIYKNRAADRAQDAENWREQLVAEHDKFVRLDKKVHPSKYKANKAKKVSKK